MERKVKYYSSVKYKSGFSSLLDERDCNGREKPLWISPLSIRAFFVVGYFFKLPF